MPAIAVAVESVGKVYRLFERPQHRLLHGLLHRFGLAWGQDFWALRGVSFVVERGKAFGVIGRNGSGKSTLLQLMAGTLAPSEGRILLAGRVAGLLELGSGFNPEFTGRENALLNGAILGLPREEMERRLPELASFAEIGEFFDRPVKLYSSGMFLRLAFAVATSIETELLLIDEALAVGDVFFQQKCYERLTRLRERGTAVVLVSHALADVEQFCDEALVLDAGRAVFQGAAGAAVREYLMLEQGSRRSKVSMRLERATAGAPEAPLRAAVPLQEAKWETPPREAFVDLRTLSQVGDGSARCVGVAVCDASGQPCRSFGQGQRAVFHYGFELLADVEVPVGGVNLRNARAVHVHGRNTLQLPCEVPRGVSAGSELWFRQEIVLDLAVGEYTFELGLAGIGREVFDRRDEMSEVDLEAALLRLCYVPDAGQLAVGLGGLRRNQHHGIAGLPGACSVRLFVPGAGGTTA